MGFIASKKGILLIALIGIFAFLYLFTGVFGETRINLTLRTNPDLQNGLVAHYTFDGEFEQGTFAFGAGGSTTTDPGDGNDYARRITVDSSGYVYIVGHADTDACGGSGTDSCELIIKMDPLDGSIVWSTTTDNGTFNEASYGVVTDSADDVYVAGYCFGCGSQGHWAFRTQKLASADGSLMWSTTTDFTSLGDRPFDIAIDNTGDLYVTGWCDGCGNVGGDAHQTFKIDGSNQNLLWATTTDLDPGDEDGKAIVTDSAGGVYVVGECDSPGCPGSGDRHYVYKLNSDTGGLIWATSTYTAQGDPNYMTIDRSGYVYVTGSCGAGSSCGLSDTGFVTYKLDPSNGDLVWSTTTNPTTNTELGYSITIDNTDNLYVTGTCAGCGSLGGDAFYTFKVDASNGDMLWATTTDPSDGDDLPDGIAVDPDGFVYVTGYASSTGCPGAGGQCFYTMKIDPNDGSMVDTTSVGAIASFGKNVEGNIGQGVAFDGVDDYVQIADSNELDLSGNMTISSWVYQEVVDQTQVVSKGGTGSVGGVENYLLQTWSDQRVYFSVYDGTQNQVNSGADDLYPLGEWFHIVGRYDGSTIKVYLNGEEVGSGNYSGTPTTNSGPLYIGRGEAGAPKVYLDGNTDDIRIYNRALTASEIERLYQLGATTKVNKTLTTNPDLKNGLVAHYTFDGDIETIIEDVSGGGNDSYFENPPSAATSTLIGPGRIGQGLEFLSGDNAFEYDDVTNNTLAGDYTMTAWVNVTSFVDFNDLFIKWQDTSNEEMFIGVRGAATTPGQIRYATNAVDCTDDFSNLDSNEILEINRWYHLTFTMDRGTEKRIFINGELDNASSVGTLTTDCDINLWIGATERSDVRDGLYGRMDDVRIYNRVLATSTIQRIYQLGATTKVNTTITTNPDLEHGLISHWTFDGPHIDVGSTTAEVLDRSENGNHGNWLDHATTTIPGVIGQALEFDGIDDEILAGDITNSNTKTWTMWIKPLRWQENQGLIAKHDGGSVEWRLLECATACGSQNGVFLNISNNGSASESQRTTNMNIPLNEWSHITVTFDNGAWDAYLNAELVSDNGDFSTHTTIFDGSASVRIGNSPSLSYFQGVADDVRIYNRVLSAAEILRLYQLGN